MRPCVSGSLPRWSCVAWHPQCKVHVLWVQNQGPPWTHTTQYGQARPEASLIETAFSCKSMFSPCMLRNHLPPDFKTFTFIYTTCGGHNPQFKKLGCPLLKSSSRTVVLPGKYALKIALALTVFLRALWPPLGRFTSDTCRSGMILISTARIALSHTHP